MAWAGLRCRLRFATGAFSCDPQTTRGEQICVAVPHELVVIRAL
jgi:hypothetical protein